MSASCRWLAVAAALAAGCAADFGKQVIGSATDRTITVTNGGNVDSGPLSRTV